MRLGLNYVPVPASRHIGAVLSPLTPPDSVDWAAVALDRSGVDIFDGDCLGNDELGNCVPCGALRSIQVRRAVVAGDARRPSATQSEAIYRAWAGWDGTDATDLGTDSDKAAILWARDGVKWGEQWEDVPAVVPMRTDSPFLVKSAIAFLGPVQIDLNLPRRWNSERVVWDVQAGDDIEGGHRVCGVGYHPDGIKLETWGLERLLTWTALRTYGLGLWATVTRSWIDTTGLSPPGLDLAALEAEAHALAA